MNKDDVLKMTVEALENAISYGSLTGAEWVFDAVDKAIAAGKEILEEQKRTDSFIYQLDKAIEAPDQEPVAIADGTFNHNCPVGRLLYTSPPASKPLTDEEIICIEETIPADVNGVRPPIDFARAIEAAHGIKE